MAAILEEIKGLGFKGKKAVAFWTYGWSGEGIKIISSRLSEAGFEIVDKGIRTLWNPDAQSLDQCFEFVSTIADLCPFSQ